MKPNLICPICDKKLVHSATSNDNSSIYYRCECYPIFNSWNHYHNMWFRWTDKGDWIKSDIYPKVKGFIFR